jgi:hypothetical protein
VRRPVDAHPDFYAYWSDGNPDRFSECHLYFTNYAGDRMWRLPYTMSGDSAAPEEVVPQRAEPRRGPAVQAEKPQLVSVRKIWDAAPHNAFTDLLRWHDKWYCTFRESEKHVGGDGKIRVIESPGGETWRSKALIAEQGIDLRDPKLSITPDDRLMILCGGSVYHGGTKLLGAGAAAAGLLLP